MYNKYRNQKVKYKGITFDSKAEFEFYLYLQSEGHKDIVLQPKFELQPKFRDNTGTLNRAITYTADFQINNIVYDVKGMETDVFKIKKKLFKYKFPELELKLVVKAPKYYGKPFVEIEELKKIRKERKKRAD